jgi:hypothetical protein
MRKSVSGGMRGIEMKRYELRRKCWGEIECNKGLKAA